MSPQHNESRILHDFIPVWHKEHLQIRMWVVCRTISMLTLHCQLKLIEMLMQESLIVYLKTTSLPAHKQLMYNSPCCKTHPSKKVTFPTEVTWHQVNTHAQYPLLNSSHFSMTGWLLSSNIDANCSSKSLSILCRKNVKKKILVLENHLWFAFDTISMR